MKFTKQLVQSLSTLLILTFSLFSISCSDEDDGPNDPATDDTESYYDISIEGEGDFTRNNIDVDVANQVNVGGIWYESPDTDGELITVLIEDSESDGFTFSSSIILLDGNPAPVDSPSNYDDENPQTSLINIQADGVDYISNSGSISISNLELIPEDIPETPGETAFANFNMSFTAEFDIVETFDEVENIEISGDLKISNPSF